jgi:hypothetical protein
MSPKIVIVVIILIFFPHSSQKIVPKIPTKYGKTLCLSWPTPRKHTWLNLRGGSGISFDSHGWMLPDSSLEGHALVEARREDTNSSLPPNFTAMQQQTMQEDMQFEEVLPVRNNEESFVMQAGHPDLPHHAMDGQDPDPTAPQEQSEFEEIVPTRHSTATHEGNNAQVDNQSPWRASGRSPSNSATTRTRKRSASQMSSPSNSPPPRSASPIIKGTVSDARRDDFVSQSCDFVGGGLEIRPKTGEAKDEADFVRKHAQNEVGNMTIPKRTNVEYDKIRELLATAVEANDTESIQNHTAYMFERGVKAMQCDNGACQAVFWWKKAAEAGHVDAMFNMGICCLQGVGTEEGCNETAAAVWFERAALKGDVDARVRALVGTCLYLFWLTLHSLHLLLWLSVEILESTSLVCPPLPCVLESVACVAAIHKDPFRISSVEVRVYVFQVPERRKDSYDRAHCTKIVLAA